ncbi:hypothetical protein LA303_03395 [Candidatus Sulfidibacterium hydrothermale]|uniref:hypothetical protein n=1 Tax=Candidatus Sulfidibacterium hydrothermale TaxID=2875962 RepID=UPI001F0A4BC3|nr:hypothetical protein [Candidatus Sulfidibacterium hydrothermale]UBM63029.1 hypothetical protein LA303_03395 [Candidatus Sulfidibacterium hydrothermale]
MTAEEKIKPGFLKVLLILTFIGSGMTMLSNLLIFTFFDQMKMVVTTQMANYTFMGTKMDFTPFFEISPLFYLIQGLLSALSLSGAILMWDLRKLGFHLYTIAQILLLIVPKLFIKGLPFPGMELLISFIFVFYYSRFLKIMR